MNEERKKSPIERAVDEKMIFYGGALGGMLAGQALDNPINALANDIRDKRKLKKADPNKVVLFKNIVNPNDKDAMAGMKNLKRQRLKRYIPKPGLPKSKSAFVGGIVGSTIAPIAVAQIKEHKEQERFIGDLEKEAYESYVNLPKIEKPRFL